MTRYDELLRGVVDDPESDPARLAFAAHVRASDPERAQLIEEQVASAMRRRNRRGPVDSQPHPLVTKRDAEWSRTLAKYASAWTYDRGFVARMRIEPYLFLEYGEWLFVNAPIREIELSPPDGGTFPTAELAASPLLAHLDTLAIDAPSLTSRDLEQLAASPHLVRLLTLTATAPRVEPSVYDALAAAPLVQKALFVSVTKDGHPGQRYADTGQDDMMGRAIHAWSELSAQGKAIEARHGYVPWLHPGDNLCESIDAAWLVAQRILPVKPVGSR